MLRVVFVLGLSLAFVRSTALAGGYGKTNWGMRLKQVKTLYPGGLVENGDDGVVRYRVIAEVASFPGTLLQFEFKAGTLKSVYAVFPKPGTVVTLEKDGSPQYEMATVEEARDVYERIRSGLTLKYGVSRKSIVAETKDPIALLKQDFRVDVWIPSGSLCVRLAERFTPKGEPPNPDLVMMVYVQYTDCIATATEGL
jgi:hypothetical protein